MAETNYLRKYNLDEKKVVDWGMQKYPNYIKNIDFIGYMYAREHGLIKEYKRTEFNFVETDYKKIKITDIPFNIGMKVKLKGIIMRKIVSAVKICSNCRKFTKTLKCPVCNKEDTKERTKVALQIGTEESNMWISYLEGSWLQFKEPDEFKEYMIFGVPEEYKQGYVLRVHYIKEYEKEIDDKVKETLNYIYDFISLAGVEPLTVEKQKFDNFLITRKINFEDIKSFFEEYNNGDKQMIRMNYIRDEE